MISNPSASIRSFIAVDLSEELQERLFAIVLQFMQQLKRQTPTPHYELIRWASKENIHLTLHFLGDIDQISLQNIHQQLQTTLYNLPIFTLQVSSIGAFPNLHRPRVLWVGIQQSEELSYLYQIITPIISQFRCIIEERNFHAHLTLGRVKNDIENIYLKEISNVISQFSKDPAIGSIEVDKVNIYRSVLKPSGADYTKLFTIPLHNCSH